MFVSAGCCGRTSSRYFGKEYRQTLDIHDCEKIYSVSFDHRAGSTVKDVTYLSTDGYCYTQEFVDNSVLEGRIKWVPANTPESVLQSRTLSRYGFGDVCLHLPDDFKEMVNIDITYDSGSERVKNVVYVNTEGKIMAKEYREGFFDRKFCGWLEVKVNNPVPKKSK